MTITSGEHYIELQPETDYEFEQLKRLVGRRITLEVIDPPFARNWPSVERGAGFRIHIEEPRVRQP
jgi:hypothetical protein